MECHVNSPVRQYQTLDVQTAVSGADPHQLIDMLFQGASDRIRQGSSCSSLASRRRTSPNRSGPRLGAMAPLVRADRGGVRSRDGGHHSAARYSVPRDPWRDTGRTVRRVAARGDAARRDRDVGRRWSLAAPGRAPALSGDSRSVPGERRRLTGVGRGQQVGSTAIGSARHLSCCRLPFSGAGHRRVRARCFMRLRRKTGP